MKHLPGLVLCSVFLISCGVSAEMPARSSTAVAEKGSNETQKSKAAKPLIPSKPNPQAPKVTPLPTADK